MRMREAVSERAASAFLNRVSPSAVVSVRSSWFPIEYKVFHLSVPGRIVTVEAGEELRNCRQGRLPYLRYGLAWNYVSLKWMPVEWDWIP